LLRIKLARVLQKNVAIASTDVEVLIFAWQGFPSPRDEARCTIHDDRGYCVLVVINVGFEKEAHSAK
jgi:hypothetical protein